MTTNINFEQLEKDAVEIFTSGFACSESVIYTIRKHFDVNIPDEEDLFKISEACNKNPEKPEIYLGVGTEDFLYESNQKFKKHLENIGYEFTYRESAGMHNWFFWDEYIQYVLKWMFE